MTTLDQFESVFRAAQREVFHHAPPKLDRILVISDLDGDEAELFEGSVRARSSGLQTAPSEWQKLRGADLSGLGPLLERVEKSKPDLIVSYRHLRGDGWRWPYGLGEYLDTLSQATQAPVMVLPHPRRVEVRSDQQPATTTMLMTDHIAGSETAVNMAAAMTPAQGRLWLTHVEDEAAFEHVMAAIGKIPGIDTEQTRKALHHRLLADPLNYVDSCKAVLSRVRADLKVDVEVTMGSHLASYRRLVESHEVELLIMNTKDRDQMAMHGLAYPLAVEMRDISLLLL